MIKKIQASHLQVGMFVHDLDIGWIDHPFWGKRFRVSSERQLAKVRALKLQEVYIDTDRGSDITEGVEVSEVIHAIENILQETATAPSSEAITATLQEAVTHPAPAQKATPLQETITPERNEWKKIPLRTEWPRAMKAKKEATQIVSKLISNIRLGGSVRVEYAESVVEEIVQSVIHNHEALLGMMSIREPELYDIEHSVSVSILLATFGKFLGMSSQSIQQIALGGLLHDIGITKVPLSIMQKRGPLTNREFDIMCRHVDYAREMLQSSELPTITQEVIFDHHERLDGSGYPLGKEGDELSQYARMIAIVDVYDALTSDRCYKQANPSRFILGKLIEWSKHHFDAQLVQLFIRCIGIYPIGTLVRLQSGRLAVVTELNETDRMRPVVKVCYDKDHQCPLPHTRVDLAQQDSDPADKIMDSELPGEYGLQMDAILAP